MNDVLVTLAKLIGLALLAVLVIAVPVLVVAYVFYSMYGVATGIHFLPVIWFSMAEPMPILGAVLVMFAFMFVMPKIIWRPAYIVCGVWATYTFWGWPLQKQGSDRVVQVSYSLYVSWEQTVTQDPRPETRLVI